MPRTWNTFRLLQTVCLGVTLIAAFPGPADAVSLITPYVNESDMASINEAFSVGDCNPWGFTWDHRGIDFFPTGNNKPFRAACGGTVDAVDMFLNSGNGLYQVNVRIDCNATEGVGYAFEPASAQESDGVLQLSQIAVFVDQTLAQGDLVGTLLKVGSGAHVHFDYYNHGEAVCPEEVFTPTAKASILNVLHVVWPQARMCYGLPRGIARASISADGIPNDWLGLEAEAGDWENDDQSSPPYDGDDIQALYMARDDTNLYLRMDLWDNVNTSFQNGVSPNEGRYSISIMNDGPSPDLYFSVAYDSVSSEWSLGHAGSNGPGTPPQLQGPQFVGVSGQVIEVEIPLIDIGLPKVFNWARGEVADCCVSSTVTTLDATHCVRELRLPLFEDGFESGDPCFWSSNVGWPTCG